MIDEKGKNIGEMDVYNAIADAKSKKLDLMCVNPKATPPICKVCNYDTPLLVNLCLYYWL